MIVQRPVQRSQKYHGWPFLLLTTLVSLGIAGCRLGSFFLHGSSPHSLNVTDNENDRSSAVIGLAVGYNLPLLERFVGSLRQTGYRGHIILGVGPDVSASVLNYLSSQSVQVQRLEWTTCQYPYKQGTKDTITCAKPYPQLKIRWGRYPLARDWLQACETCTGPVLVTDVRDVLFQRNPFRHEAVNRIQGLQLFAEHPYQSTLFKLVRKPLQKCKHIKWDKTMLCSGTTVGTRHAMLHYLQVMAEELKDWASHKDCRLVNKQGGDQAVHNYVYYSGKLTKHNTRVVPFDDPDSIVTTAGVWGNVVHTDSNGTVQSWHDLQQWNVTDAQGYFRQGAMTRASVVHQFDRFGWVPGYSQWLNEKELENTATPL